MAGKKHTPARKPKKSTWTDDEIICAIHASTGIIIKAAAKLGCSAQLIYLRSRSNPDIARAIKYKRRELVDLAEDVIVGAVKAGDAQVSWNVLKTLGKKRGYYELAKVHTGQDKDAAPQQVQYQTIHSLPFELREQILLHMRGQGNPQQLLDVAQVQHQLPAPTLPPVE